MKVVIVSIGDELLIGQVVNTNAAAMSQMLTASNFDVVRVVTISDKAEDIEECLRTSLQMADVVLITGGLGPTKDDITKHTLCRFFGAKLIEDAASLRNVEERFKVLGYEVTPINRQQALVPDNCTVLLNKMGTAPGMWFDVDGKIVVSMPGVPDEMQYLMEQCVMPKLRSRLDNSEIVQTNVIFQGIGESFLSDLVEQWELALPKNIRVAYLPQAGMIKMRITATGTDRQAIEQQLFAERDKLIAIAGQYVAGIDCQSMEECVAQKMLQHGTTLTSAESCTGGTIASRITRLPGASQYFKGGFVVYSNELKENILGVRHDTLETFGAVSEETVTQMAENARRRANADYAVATTGVAGPSGGTPQKPVGTVWIGVASAHKTVTRVLHLGNNRSRTVERTVNNVFMDLLKLVDEECGR